MNRFIEDHLDKLNKKFSNAELELKILVNKSLYKKKETILSNLNLEDIDLMKFQNFFQRRMNHEPISKIFNSKNFWKYDFYVTSDVLDPRPETELIVEQIIEHFPLKTEKLKILDICTGSGCIPICLAKEYLNSKIVATDISNKAIKIAKINAIKNNCEKQISYINCDLIKKIDQYDIVICNPPYLSELEYEVTSLGIKKFEPKIALVSKKEGYEFYYRLSKVLPYLLGKNSLGFVEIGHKQASKTINIFKSCNISLVKLVKDIQKLDRLLILNKP